ncbi:MAG: hypothetical protein ACLQMH_06125 [Solirubrobacteraceae bacterium]
MANATLPLSQALRAAWESDTTADPERWSCGNPAWGQCAVTALIVQDLLGGQLLRCDGPSGSHYWNRLPDGTELDLTRDQFHSGLRPRNIEERDRGYVLSYPETRRRYEALRTRVCAILNEAA